MQGWHTTFLSSHLHYDTKSQYRRELNEVLGWPQQLVGLSIALQLQPEAVGLPVRFARKPATSTKSYMGRVVLVGIASGFRSVG